jgi:NTE family protein
VKSPPVPYLSLRPWLPAIAALLLAACGGTRPEAPAQVAVAPAVPALPDPVVPPLRIGLALGGGAAKGFAHIGVIKMLEANGFKPEVVAGTSAGSVVGALYASGMDPFRLQERAVALDESSLRDVRLFSGGLVQGLALQDYVNASVDNRPIERMRKPFAAVATRLETGERTVFVRGNTGQAVRASSSVPGVFEPVTIGNYQYVDGGVVSPVPVDAARQLGADFVIAVDISSKARGRRPDGMLGIVGQSIAIMGQRLGEQELARADVVIRPKVLEIGGADFSQRNRAILEGEKAALAALPQIRAGLEKLQAQRLVEAREQQARVATQRAAALAPAAEPECDDAGSRWNPLRRKNGGCVAASR